jgi:hypothetical protein
MAQLTAIVKQLKKERDRLERQLHGMNAALVAFASVYSGAKPSRKRRKLSIAARKRIASAQRARWAKIKGQRNSVPIASKRTMSASTRRRIAAAQRARWAKFRTKRDKKSS